MQYYRETGIYAERTAPWLRRLGFENVKEVLLDPERQNELFERIMDAKKQSKLNLGKQSLVMRKLEKSLKWRRCNTWKRKRKIKVTTLDELTPLIGKKVIVKGKEIGLFLTESGTIHAIHNICPHKQGPLSEGTVSGEYVFCPLHDQKIDLNTGIVQEPDEGCVDVYEVEVTDGNVYICL